MRLRSLIFNKLGIFLFGLLLLSSCVTKKKKGEVSKFGKFYHNLTSEYNGYFNANELYQQSLLTLKDANNDNYSKILEVYDYVSVSDPKVVNADLDKAVEKVTKVATIHEPGDWVDDCYVLMGKAQYLKQDYEKSLETLEFFEAEFNPSNPYGKGFKKKKLSSKQKQKLLKADREVEKKKKEEKREEEQKLKDEKREEQKKEKEEAAKTREEQRKLVQKQREEDKKAREKQREADKKSRKKNPRSKREVRKDTTSTKINTSPKSTTTSNTVQPQVKEETVEEEVIEEPEEEVQANTKKPKEAEDKTAYTEGLVWLAKAYSKTEQYSAADFLLRRIEKSAKLSGNVKDELYPAYADLHIKQKDYNEALTYLDLAIKESGSKNDKARYAYIAGQIHQMNRNHGEAIEYFKTAKSKAKDFKLRFMSELGIAKNTALSGGKNNEEVVKQLERFVKDDKYSEFLDQIYYSLAEIVLPTDITKAKEYFALSSSKNTSDKSLKTEACYHLAKLHMSDKKYDKAKLYFDTTLVSLPKSDDRYSEVKNLAANLTSIAKNLETIERVDSLLTMAELPEEELKKIAKKRLEEEIKSGNKKMPVVDNQKSGFIPSKGAGAGFSNFFAYNKSQVQSGKVSFEKKWGQRKLEDNWRRMSKSSDTETDLSTIANTNPDEITEREVELSDAEFKRIMSDIPLSSFQKEQLRNDLKKALFELGKDYRTKLQEYALSAETLETFETKFPGTTDEAEAYYFLYLDYRDLANNNLAEKYKSLLNQKYADNKYAKLANDPSYINGLTSDDKKLDVFYDQSYEMFQKGQYDKVITRVKSAEDAFGKENKLMAKFSLLNAMCLGATQGREVYIASLKEVIVRYPKTNEETKAKEILRFLGGDNAAFDQIDSKEVDNLFQLDDNSRHYVAVIVLSYDAGVFDEAKISISEYNKQYHSLENLQMGEQILSMEEKTQLILVRSFDSREKAMKYYDGVEKSREQFISSEIANFEIYPITQNNYRKMTQDKSHRKYRVWFEKNYLNK